jgi:thioester reductase-like protein
VTGDLTAKKLGVAADAIKALKGQIDHVYHLAAVYDLSADEDSQVQVNIEGTRNMVEFAKAVDAGHVHHVSSIAAAGLYEGVFREDMFDEAEGLDHPYFMTKHESEKIVRKECKVPWTVYRPAMVVGDSTTGEMDKIDGPYYFFKLIQRMRQILPPWMPSVGLEGGRINIVPVDFVVKALDHISHQGAGCGKLLPPGGPAGLPRGRRARHLQQGRARAQDEPVRQRRAAGLHSQEREEGLMALAPVRRVRNAVMKDLGLPEDMFTFINYPTRFDRRETDAALKGSGIECPNLHDYAWRLWDYWERHLDPDLFIDRSLKGTVGGKVVLVTGGSSGIGLAAATSLPRPAPPPSSAGATRTSWTKPAGDPAKAKGGKDAQVIAYSGRHRRHGRLRPLRQAAGSKPRRRRLPDQQRRPQHPPRHREQLRPLPRLRAHHAAQLLRLPARHHGPAAGHGGQEAQGPCGQHQQHRRADQRAALQRLRGQQGGAGRLDALRQQRVCRPGHQLHHHQHAAGAHADDRAHQDLQQRAHAGPEEAADMIAQACI